jgi:hypothetical protein
MLTRPALPQPPGSCDADMRAPCGDVRVLDKALCAVPMSTVTIVEDLLMVGMAAITLFLSI